MASAIRRTISIVQSPNLALYFPINNEVLGKPPNTANYRSAITELNTSHHDPEECGKDLACIVNISQEKVFDTLMQFV